MPTIPKLVSFLAFGILGYIAALTFGNHLPEGMSLGQVPGYSAAFGAIIAWFVMGPNTGGGYVAAIGTGIRAAVLNVFSVLLVFSIYLMIKKSTHMMYDGPMEAVLGIFDFMYDYGRKLIAQDFLTVIFAGGALGGVVAEFCGKRWK